ncbi:hypothetical protein BDM02DRAFT_1945289 [Thelephora ganbajun]|uniref:Uncharacterized protein n=1 Tax=Thelephora ganbajun TaxID=370292 RepID=A0ACB6ZJ61_THEGA|nr:hypothetical protein BDM02DRAFT_1945289 [Thelephora ganbajun]
MDLSLMWCPIWQRAKVESERGLMFEEHTSELKQWESQESRAACSRSIGKLANPLKELQVDVLAKWWAARSMVLESDARNRTGPEMQEFSNLDILLAFVDYSRVREKEFRRAGKEDAGREEQGRGKGEGGGGPRLSYRISSISEDICCKDILRDTGLLTMVAGNNFTRDERFDAHIINLLRPDILRRILAAYSTAVCVPSLITANAPTQLFLFHDENR